MSGKDEARPQEIGNVMTHAAKPAVRFQSELEWRMRKRAPEHSHSAWKWTRAI